jgi:hypothetical protein
MDIVPAHSPLPARREGPGVGAPPKSHCQMDTHPPLTPPCVQGGEA